MRYIVYTWKSGYFCTINAVFAESYDEALWKGVDLAIKNDNINYIDIETADSNFNELDADEKEGYDDFMDYYIFYMGYTYHDNENDFIGFVNLENTRVISEDDDEFERALRGL